MTPKMSRKMKKAAKKLGLSRKNKYMRNEDGSRFQRVVFVKNKKLSKLWVKYQFCRSA